jgi:FixJ family two-component response regulator
VNDHGPIIYIVDDDVSVRRALSLLLKSHGFSVQAFACSADFLAFKHPKTPSCLVLDFRLPDINGLALQETMTASQLRIPLYLLRDTAISL